jgi:hypothetical protein
MLDYVLATNYEWMILLLNAAIYGIEAICRSAELELCNLVLPEIGEAMAKNSVLASNRRSPG